MALSPAVKDYWLLRLAANDEPWARYQPLTAWAELADSNPHLRMDAHAMRTRFYMLVEQFEPQKPLDDDATDLDLRLHDKLLEICAKLESFHQKKEQKRIVLVDYERAVEELEQSEVAEQHDEASDTDDVYDGNDALNDLLRRILPPIETGPIRRHDDSANGERTDNESLTSPLAQLEATIETPVFGSPSYSDPGNENVHPNSISERVDTTKKSLKRRREAFWEQQVELLRMQLRVDKMQTELYSELLTRKAHTSGSFSQSEAIDRQLQLLDDQVALQRDQVRLQERQLALMREMMSTKTT